MLLLQLEKTTLRLSFLAVFCIAYLCACAHTHMLATAAPGGPAATPLPDNATYELYKFLNAIGTESDTFLRSSDGGIDAKANFTFNDRGRDVPLAAHYQFGPDGTPRRYEAWGSISRYSTIDDSVSAAGDGTYVVRHRNGPEARTAPHMPFAITSGYSPILGQQLLVRSWIAQGRPPKLALLPEGNATIESRGQENYEHDGKPLTLEHLAVQGLVWGREDIWIDDASRLVAVVARDAEFDHFEALRTPYEHLADTLVERAGNDSIAWLGAAMSRAETIHPGLVALTGGRLIDGTDRPAIEDAVVVYDGDRIVSAGARVNTPIPPNASLVDIHGKTVLPGLWDMHAHVEQVEQAPAYLAAGVTTVRDVGNILPFITSIRDAIENGRGRGPRLLVDGLVDGSGSRALGTLRIDKTADIGPTLDKLKHAGCLEVKIYSSIRPELVKPIVEEAHRRGLRVTGHVPLEMDIMQVLDAGFDGVNHLGYLSVLLSPSLRDTKLSLQERVERAVNLDFKSPSVQAVFDKLAAKKPIFDDTLVFYDLNMHTLADLYKREPGLAKQPPQLADVYQGASPADAKIESALFDWNLKVLGELHRRGVPVVAGTDQGVIGHSLLREIELYVQAGFTPLEAIQAATIVPARAMRLDAQFGTIEPGKHADLVVVSGNPLTDIHDIRKITTVIARGHGYDPAELWKLAGFKP